MHPAIENLRDCQRQLDMDGCEVAVSRQAVEETLGVADALLSIAQRWAAIDEGVWNAARYVREHAELLADTHAAIAKATAEGMTMIRTPLTPRQEAEAIEAFGDDLTRLLVRLDKLCADMSAANIGRINAIPNVEHIDAVAKELQALGDRLCRECDAEAEERRRANPLEPRF